MEIDQFTRAKIKVMNRVQSAVRSLDGVGQAMTLQLGKVTTNAERESIKKSLKEIQAIHRFQLNVQGSKNYLDIHKASDKLNKEIKEFLPFIETMNDDLFDIIESEI